MSQENLVEFEDYVAAIGRRRRLIGIVVAAFVVLGAGYSVLSTKTYTSESRVSVTPVFDPGTATTEEVNIDTERGIAQSSAVATIAQRILRSDTNPSDLLDRVGVEAIGESTILSIRYTHSSPQAAFRGADAFARAYLEFRGSQADEANRQAREGIADEKAANAAEIQRLEADLAELGPGSPAYADTTARIRALDGAQAGLDRQLEDLASETVDPGTIIDEAEVPESPSNPGLVLNVAGAALIGLVLALTATFVLERKNLGTRTAGPSAEDAAAVPAPELPPGDGAASGPDGGASVVPPGAAASLASVLDRSSGPSARPVEPEIPRRRPAARPVAALPPADQPATPAAPAAAADRRQRRDASQALAGLGVEVLGNVPRLSNDAGEPAFESVALGGPAGEALRRLHATLRPRLDQAGARVVFVTSAIERGVTVGLAGGLAATAALADQDALLIAGDLHQPRLHDRLELGNDQGLAEVLKGQRPLNQVLQGWSGIEALCVVTSGRPGPDPSALVTAERLGQQLATIRGEFQLIVIEGPPVGEGADATVMAAVSDAVILAVDPRHSGEQELGDAVGRLRLAGADLLGAVVVEARAPRPAGTPVAAAPSRS